MRFLETAIVLCGLFCFPFTVIIQEWGTRPIWAVGLLFAIVGSVLWDLHDWQPSSNTRYSALGYAVVLLLSAYLYFTSLKKAASTVVAGRWIDIVTENARWFVIGLVFVFAATIYACENRYQIVPERGSFSPYVKVLDRWTGEVIKK
jgi:hypothetical protein